MKIATFIWIGLATTTASAGNLQLIQENPANGFALYRSGAPSKNDFKEYCRLGIQEVMVLSGSAEDHEEKYAPLCPGLKVIYNQKQNESVPLTRSFLKQFDDWVQDAQANGKKILFRCNCGCHRTGRLAAYYQMKYQGLSQKDAVILMDKHGKYMVFFQSLYPQVQALEDEIYGRPCSVAEKYCVI